MSVFTSLYILRFLLSSAVAEVVWSARETQELQSYLGPQFFLERRRQRLRESSQGLTAFALENESRVAGQTLKGAGVAGELERLDWALWVEKKHE